MLVSPSMDVSRRPSPGPQTPGLRNTVSTTLVSYRFLGVGGFTTDLFAAERPIQVAIIVGNGLPVRILYLVRVGRTAWSRGWNLGVSIVVIGGKLIAIPLKFRGFPLDA